MAMIIVQTDLKLSWRNDSSIAGLLQSLPGSSGTLHNSAAEDDIGWWVRITCSKCIQTIPQPLSQSNGQARGPGGSFW